MQSLDLGRSPTIEIQGIKVPTFLYGTAWKEDDTERCVRDALEAGFVGIDTANQRKHYFEAGVGAAIRPFLARQGRDSLFLQTKFTYVGGQDHRLPYDPAAPLAAQVRQSFASSLEHLGVEWIDSYVLHGPQSRPGLSEGDWEVWREMEALHAAGKVRLLGISNVTAEQVSALVAGAKVRPAFVQNRCFAQLGWDAPVRTVCRENGVLYQGFSLLTANRHVWNDRRLHDLARKTGATPAQVLFRFALRIGILPLTGTTDPAHMRQDLAARELSLADEDLRLIVELG